MGLNVGESHAVAAIRDYLLQHPPKPGTAAAEKLGEHLAVLSDGAYRRMQTGSTAEQARQDWAETIARKAAGPAPVSMRDGELVCPYCGGAGQIVLTLSADRNDPVVVTGPRTVKITESTADGAPWFEPDEYACTSCLRRVSVPDSWTVIDE